MTKQTVLIIGGGGREHALAWKVSQSEHLEKLYIAPGNGGTEELGQNVSIAATDIGALARFAKTNKIDLTIVGPDAPLALGIVDQFKKAGLRVFGPTQSAAQIESSKAFAKSLMSDLGIPTADSRIFNRYEEAVEYVKSHEMPIVIKASGLAEGKGVYVCHTSAQAQAALKQIMVAKIHGEAGDQVIVEEYLEGPEVSLHALSDGKTSLLFPPTQDHKQLKKGDTGPNTGGMGAYGPVPGLSPQFMTKAAKTVIEPTLMALKKQAEPFVGCLYPGLKLLPDGPRVLEYNARFGDPETQVYMRLLENDLLEVLNACIDGKLANIKLKWRSGFAVCVVMVANGYPGVYKIGKPIYGINKVHEIEGVVVFQAGTKRVNRRLLTSGGRVLNISAVGDTLDEAIATAYKAVKQIVFEGMQYRRDIGAKSLSEAKVER